jgi:hypothetical protein
MMIDRCPPLLRGWCGWLRVICGGISDNEILARSGLEASLYQQWMRTNIIFICVVSFLSAGILAPLNASGNWNEQQAKEAGRV